jgi:hypothetical protein
MQPKGAEPVGHECRRLPILIGAGLSSSESRAAEFRNVCHHPLGGDLFQPAFNPITR